MDYQRIYDSIVGRARSRTLTEYSELHHIIPLCMGGDNSSENLVRLTYREHFIAHALLYRIHKTSKLAHAWFSMLRQGRGQKRQFTSRQYEKARSAHVAAMKKQVGKNNPFYGKKHSQESRDKISRANTGRTRSESTVKKWVADVAKKPKSKEHRAKISRKGFIMLKNTITGECVRILREDKEKFDLNVWKNPYSIACELKKQISL